jgi:hypothetical protein
MKSRMVSNQAGYAVLVMVLVLMGMGGVVLAGFSQEARQEVYAKRYAHNERVLKEAKQALLMYAYNYPQFNSEGPGRLPCPDTDNDGNAGDDILGPPWVNLAICTSVGRFPWNHSNMDFYDARDASGERLWYAVSNQFYNLGGGPVINSNSVGSITIQDQNGSLIYDGLVAGVAAVIIAPGPAITRDENDDGIYEYTQVRGTAAEQIDPRNYLDTFNAFDHSVFTNLESDTDDDGFIVGQVVERDPASPAVNTIVVNDQLIVVTAEEVIAMAEKATLQAYRNAISDYLTNTSDTYPWLDSFVTDDLNVFDADIGSIRGRVPAVFSNYFSGDTVDAYASGTKIRLEMPVSAPAPGGVIIHTPPPTFADVSFDAGGDLVTSLNSMVTVTRYFWDGHPTQATTLPMDGVWEMCPVVTNDEEDCNQNAGGGYIGGTDSDVWLQVYKLTITLNSGAGALEFPDAQLVSAGPYAYTPADDDEHAYIFGNYSNGATNISIDWEYDDDFQSTFDIQAFGNLTDAAVGVVYYPELPAWAFTNDWHHSIQMAIAEDYKPDGNNADCTVNGCLVVNNLGGVNNDKVSLLVIAGEIDNLVDDGAAGFLDDLTTQFEVENNTLNITYDRRAGNDSVLVMQ